MGRRMAIKIGVFGDSFARMYVPNKQWWEIINESKKLEVENFGHPGTPVYFSYKHFMENYKKFDRTIFFYTNPGRLWLPWLEDIDLNYCHNATVLQRKNIPNTLKANRVKKALAGYFQYIKFDEFDKEMWKLQINELKRISPGTLFIPSFAKHNEADPMPMVRIARLDDTEGKDSMDNSTGQDMRGCHMNINNNKVFADKIRIWLKTGKFGHSIEDYKTKEPGEYTYSNVRI